MPDRSNYNLNETIEDLIHEWRGTVFGKQLENAYDGQTSYEGLCQMACIDADGCLEDD